MRRFPYIRPCTASPTTGDPSEGTCAAADEPAQTRHRHLGPQLTWGSHLGLCHTVASLHETSSVLPGLTLLPPTPDNHRSFECPQSFALPRVSCGWNRTDGLLSPRSLHLQFLRVFAWPAAHRLSSEYCSVAWRDHDLPVTC